MEIYALPPVLHRESLHLHPPGHQLIPLEHWGDPVENMILRLLHIVGHQVFKGEHPLHIEVAGAGDQVLLVGVLPSELKAQQVAAVIQVLPVHIVVLGGFPARGLHLSDRAPLLGGHGLQTHTGIGRSAPAQAVQGTVLLKGLRRPLLFRKIWPVVLQHHIGLAGKFRDVLQVEGRGGSGRPAGGQQQAQQQKQR